MTSDFPKDILERLANSGVVAGFSVDRVDFAIPVAEALLAGGIDAIEFTLRTPVAMEALETICREVPELLVGAGTILTPGMTKEVRAAGADFGVAPGMNQQVVRTAQEIDLPFAPGIATPSELESAIDLGCRFVKFFPAEPIGGVEYLRAMSAPYKHLGIQFFPLGGVNTENMVTYLKEPNVVAVGGSWIVPNDLVANEDWSGITARAAEVRAILADHNVQNREVVGVS